MHSTHEVVFLHYPEIRAENWALFQDSARARGIRLISWLPHLVDVLCTDQGVVGRYAGEPVRPDKVVHRTVSSFPGILIPVLRLWAADGAVVLNSPVDAFRSRDKLLTYLALWDAGIPIVPTISYFKPNVPDLTALSDDRVIIKPGHGVRGEGIDVLSAAAAIDREQWSDPGPTPGGLHCIREHYLAQPLIEGGGSDLRAYVVGDKCLGVMRRSARPGEVRANLALGATGSPLAFDHPAAAIAVAAVRACGLDHAGVDLIEDDQGVLRVLEVDAWAGFAGITGITGADVAGAILDLATTRG